MQVLQKPMPFFRIALITLTQLNTFTPGSCPIEPQYDLMSGWGLRALLKVTSAGKGPPNLTTKYVICPCSAEYTHRGVF